MRGYGFPYCFGPFCPGETPFPVRRCGDAPGDFAWRDGNVACHTHGDGDGGLLESGPYWPQT
jgi:hypothetical protein